VHRLPRRRQQLWRRRCSGRRPRRSCRRARPPAPPTAPPAQAAAPEVAALLAKDAFLVFRALCKLSIRTADAAAHTDLTALRGKARRRPYVSPGRAESAQQG